MSNDFGIFAPVFQAPHGYLSLLHLSAPDALHAISLIRQCCKSVEFPETEIAQLLGDLNWRPHLVAAVAITVSEPSTAIFDDLWRALDAGSWVIPQLAAVASLYDPGFKEHAGLRLSNLCPINYSRARKDFDVKKYLADGSLPTRSSKAAASLLALLPDLRPSTKLQELVATDQDNCADLVINWKSKLNELIGSLG